MGWLEDQRAKAELEAHRERARQGFGKLNNIKTSEWVQGVMYLESAKTLDELKRVCSSYGIAWEETGSMTTNTVKIAEVEEQIKNLTKQLDKLKYGRMGKEPANGTVLKIEKRYSYSGGDKYIFAAIKANGSWYLTGTGYDGTKAYTWESLKKFIGEYSRVWTLTLKEELV